jgi:hypothetical protein
VPALWKRSGRMTRERPAQNRQIAQPDRQDERSDGEIGGAAPGRARATCPVLGGLAASTYDAVKQAKDFRNAEGGEQYTGKELREAV